MAASTHVGVDPSRSGGVTVALRRVGDRLECLDAAPDPSAARVWGVAGPRATWTPGQRRAEACRTGDGALAALAAPAPDGAPQVDPMLALAVAAAAQRPERTAVIVVVDDGVAVYRLENNSPAAVLRLGGGHPPVLSGAAVQGPASPFAGPAAVLDLLCARGHGFAGVEAADLAALNDIPGALDSGELATGYARWRAELLRAPAADDDPGLARAALALARRDILRLAATARRLDPAAPLCFAGRVFEHAELRAMTADAFATATIAAPHRTSRALGAAVQGAWSDDPDGVWRLVGRIPRGPAPHTWPAPTPIGGPKIATRKAAPSPRSAVAFEDLLAPVPLSEFFAEFADRAPLHVRGEPTRFASVLDGDRLLELVRDVHRTHPYADTLAAGIPRIDLFEAGAYLPPAPPTLPFPQHWAWSRSWAEAHASRCSWSSSIRVTGLHHIDAGLRALLWRMQALFGSHCTVNAYYSPGGTGHGLPYHFDETHVVVLQLEGSKCWRMACEPLCAPKDRAGVLAALNDGDGPPGTDVWMSKGDVLYVPAYTWHRPVALQEPSLHLTFAARCQTGTTFVQWLGEHLANDPSFHAAVTRLAPGDGPSLEMCRSRLTAVVDNIRARLDDRGLLERFLQEHDATARDKTERGALR